MPPFPSYQARVRHAVASLPQSGCSARIRLVRRFRRPPFMPFVTHIRPQAIDLRLTDPVVFQQRFFHLCRLPGCCTQPAQDRVFLDPFGARDAAMRTPSANSARVSRIVSRDA